MPMKRKRNAGILIRRKGGRHVKKKDRENLNNINVSVSNHCDDTGTKNSDNDTKNNSKRIKSNIDVTKVTNIATDTSTTSTDVEEPELFQRCRRIYTDQELTLSRTV